MVASFSRMGTTRGSPVAARSIIAIGKPHSIFRQRHSKYGFCKSMLREAEGCGLAVFPRVLPFPRRSWMFAIRLVVRIFDHIREFDNQAMPQVVRVVHLVANHDRLWVRSKIGREKLDGSAVGHEKKFGDGRCWPAEGTFSVEFLVKFFHRLLIAQLRQAHLSSSMGSIKMHIRF